jgi:hypothetical protein
MSLCDDSWVPQSYLVVGVEADGPPSDHFVRLFLWSLTPHGDNFYQQCRRDVFEGDANHQIEASPALSSYDETIGYTWTRDTCTPDIDTLKGATSRQVPIAKSNPRSLAQPRLQPCRSIIQKRNLGFRRHLQSTHIAHYATSSTDDTSSQADSDATSTSSPENHGHFSRFDSQQTLNAPVQPERQVAIEFDNFREDCPERLGTVLKDPPSEASGMQTGPILEPLGAKVLPAEQLPGSSASPESTTCTCASQPRGFDCDFDVSGLDFSGIQSFKDFKEESSQSSWTWCAEKEQWYCKAEDDDDAESVIWFPKELD